MPRWTTRLRPVLLLALLLLTAACEAEPRHYDFSVQPVGGPTGWPIWVEELTFDHTWSARAGNISSGFEYRPPRVGGVNILAHPMPAPASVQARWFSYRTQTFYEIDLELPDTDALLKQWYRDYPPSQYLHYLVTGFSGKGEVMVWWRAYCEACGRDRSRDFHAPIVESAWAEEVEGNPDWYREHIQEYVNEGVFPSPW
ncbi:DUF2931 family protein [Halomonas desiderata]|uniref:DUF2931 family protein n=2 Tax=Billgrantia desiderata TaxID=52021 RepID=A0ABS9B7N9_9GAMM|nr:DUF2931 family protein [Halomonas desiderata]MCE8042843.1 DUF2931 family protein [Halomonas desiderata]MCE8047641.1 DUF2931 family protein [Halomonas desiderata]NIC39254.1 DUF2931 family protein [Halomonas desiderata]